MGDKNQKKINTHHAQVNAAKDRQVIRYWQRRSLFEFNRAAIKVRVEGERQYLVICAMVFVLGLMLIGACFFYIAGALLYG